MKIPGLQHRTRKNGPPVTYWIASRTAINAGWPLKAVNLSETPPGEIEHRCCRLQREVTDGARTVGGIQKITGKRLMLRRPEGRA